MHHKELRTGNLSLVVIQSLSNEGVLELSRKLKRELMTMPLHIIMILVQLVYIQLQGTVQRI